MTKEAVTQNKKRGRQASISLKGHANLACEQLLLPISQYLLERGIGVGQFLHIAKVAYVRAASTSIREAGQRPTISRIAALTGLHRKEIRQLNNENADAASSSVKEPPTIRVMVAWKEHSQFCDSHGKPRALEIDGPNSFRTLAETFAGDVTHVSLLRELERLGWIRRTTAGLVAYSATSDEIRERSNEAARFAAHVADFAHALSSNHGQASYVGFRDTLVTDSRLGAALVRTFSKRAEEFLDAFERWASRSVQESAPAQQDAPSFGIGVFLVEKPASKISQQDNLLRKSRSTPRAKRA